MKSKTITTTALVLTTVFAMQGFAQTPQADISAAVSYVADDAKYLAFGDVDHNHLDPYLLAKNPNVLQALSDKGFKHIAIEAPYFLQSLIDLYAADHISSSAFIKAGDTFFDNPFIDDPDYFQMLVSLIKSAKGKGLTVNAVDSSMGILSPDTYQDYNTVVSKMSAAYATALSQNPQADLQTAIAPYAQTYQRIVQTIKPSTDQTQRYRYDHLMADKIKSLGRTGKVLIVYGNLHLERNARDKMGGDIDHHLGENNVVTMNIYYDQQKYSDANGGELWRRMQDRNSKPLFADEAPLWDQLKGVADVPEFELDIKTGRLKQTARGKSVLVTIPALD